MHGFGVFSREDTTQPYIELLVIGCSPASGQLLVTAVERRLRPEFNFKIGASYCKLDSLCQAENMVFYFTRIC